MRDQREYDRDTTAAVTKLAKAMQKSGLFTNLTDHEVSMTLTALKNATAREDIQKSVDRLTDLMLNHQVGEGKRTMAKLLKTKGTRVNQSGVQVAAGLDPHGARAIEAARDAEALTRDDLLTRIADYEDKLNSPDTGDIEKADARDRLDGLYTILAMHDHVKAHEGEMAQIKQQLTEAKTQHQAGNMSHDAYRQFRQDAEELIRQAKTDITLGYEHVNKMLSDIINGSSRNATAFRKAQQQHAEEIQHDANRDMQGLEADPHHQPTWWQRKKSNAASALQLVTSPLGTFITHLRFIGRMFPGGEGNLYNRFQRQVTDASHAEWRNYIASLRALNELASHSGKHTPASPDGFPARPDRDFDLRLLGPPSRLTARGGAYPHATHIFDVCAVGFLLLQGRWPCPALRAGNES